MDIEKPSLPLLMKLGSIAVHAEEYLSEKGHEFDRQTILALLKDGEVSEWLEGMGRKSLVPRKR